MYSGILQSVNILLFTHQPTLLQSATCHLSTHPSVNPCSHPASCPSVHPSSTHRPPTTSQLSATCLPSACLFIQLSSQKSSPSVHQLDIYSSLHSFIRLFISPPTHPFISSSLHPFIYLPIHPYIPPSVCPSICSSIHLSIRSSVYLYPSSYSLNSWVLRISNFFY